MGKCCSKSSDAKPKEPFEVVTSPELVIAANPITAPKPRTPRTPRPPATLKVRNQASQTKEIADNAKAPVPRPKLELPEVPTTPQRKQVTPGSPWEVTDGV